MGRFTPIVASSSTNSALDVVQAAYQLDGELPDWLGRVAESAAPELDGGFGVFTGTFTVTEDGRWVASSELRGPSAIDSRLALAMTTLNRAADSVESRAFLRAPPLHTASRQLEALLSEDILVSPRYAEVRALGVRDFLMVRATDTSRRGVFVVSPLAKPKRCRRAELVRWARATAHVVAGYRMMSELMPSAEAVLTASGKILHAEGPARTQSARQQLRERAQMVDRLRSRKGRSDPDAAMEAWAALVNGRWSLVDHFERGGQRFVVARRNHAPALTDTRLSWRERQVLAYAARGHSNKETAYALGLAPSTVSTHLNRGMKKLAIRDHAGLRALFPWGRDTGLDVGDSNSTS